jgi:hypothetical protein
MHHTSLMRGIDRPQTSARRDPETMTRAILIIAIFAVLISLPWWPYSAAWGYIPSVQIALIFLIIFILRILRVV